MTTLTIPNGGTGYVLTTDGNTLQYRWSTSGSAASWETVTMMDTLFNEHDIEVEFDDN